MTSCFDISIIDAWNTGDEDVINGSVDKYTALWLPQNLLHPAAGR